MKKNFRTAIIGVMAIGLGGAGAYALSNPATEAVGAETWAPSGIKSAQYQLSGAMVLPWTNMSVPSVTSVAGTDITINKEGVTYLAVSTEDNAGNTAIDMQIVVVGDAVESISPIKKIEYQLTGASSTGWTTYSAPFKVTTEGVTQINVRIEDDAGNIGTLTREVKLDKTAPINNGVTITLE